MEWTSKQDAALRAVSEWAKNPGERQVFRLFGYAGTGKTTLAKELAASCGGVAMFAAFTGKAASVMRANGCFGAKTIHQLIYKPSPKSEVRLKELHEELAKIRAEEGDAKAVLAEIRTLEKDLKSPSFVLNFDAPVRFAKLIVVDECSMVDSRMGTDLLSFGVPILVLGDPAQLPPVMGAGFFTKDAPDILLTEIHRQAEDNPIIQLATKVRSGERLKAGTYGDSVVVHLQDFDRSTAMGHDQILVGRNKTRHSSNFRAREVLGRKSRLPEEGDKLVCLRNDHKVGLLNGELSITRDSVVIDDDTLGLTIETLEGGRVLSCEAHRHPFEGRELGFFERLQAQEFDYGYALTVHKAQGSQWDSVLVFDESYCFRGDQRKWLYTAITRASTRLTVVTGV